MTSFPITSIDIFSFKIPFTRPFPVKRTVLTSREGLLLRLKGPDQVVGFGEIAPLPGVSRERLTSARKQILSFKSVLLGQSIPRDRELMKAWLKSQTSDSGLFPSVRFGIESAVLNGWACWQKKSLCQLLTGHPAPQSLSVIGLAEGTKEEAVQQVQGMLPQGIRLIKLKVGRGPMDADIEKVNQVSRLIFAKARLILDANRLWRLNEALEFAKALRSDCIEYLEEPFAPASRASWNHFFKKTKIPWALDESLDRIHPQDLDRLQGLKAIVLKPTIVGGVLTTLAWMDWAKRRDLSAVISSSLETGIGLSMLAGLALMNGALPAGLDTLKYFERDVLRKHRRRGDRGQWLIPGGPVREESVDWKFINPE